MISSVARVERFVDSCMPTQPPIYRVTDIDFERWAAEGVKGIVFDAEDTFGRAGAKLLDFELTWGAAKARRVGMRLAVGTNKEVKTRADQNLLDGWGEQLGADMVLPPLRRQDAKPSAINLQKPRTKWQLEPEEMAMVGDKATADVRAGNFAGFDHVAWTRAIGGNRHPGDRFIRDPAEAMLRLHAHIALNPKFDDLSEPELKEVLERKQAWQEFKDTHLLVPATAGIGADRIVGYGIEDIELDQAVLDTIMRPAFRVMLEQLQTGALEGTEGIRKVIDDYLYENGRVMADFATNIRPFLAAGDVLIALSNLDPKVKQKLTHYSKILRDVADGVDGFFAGAHKDGPTADGARRDALYDKIGEAATDIFGLAPYHYIEVFDVLACIGRSVSMNDLRKPFTARGFDTKAVGSGKLSTGVKSVAQSFAYKNHERHPRATQHLMRGATVLKIVSMVDGPLKWIEAYEREQHERLNFERYMAQLAINPAFDIYAAYKA